MEGKIPYRQDLPPAGGYEPLHFRRNMPSRGPSGIVALTGILGVCTYGFYLWGKGRAEKRELLREKAWSRIHLVPLLMAEGDRDIYRRSHAALARETEIMKDVEGWESGKSVYNNTKLFTPQTIVVI